MRIFRVGACARMLVSLFRVLLISTLLLSTAALATVKADDYEKALIASDKSQYDEANIHIRNLLKKQPSHLPGQLLYAEILLHKKMPAEAQAEFEKALVMGADEKNVLEHLATALFEQSKYQEVLALNADILPTSKSLKRYQLIRASAFYASGNAQAAIRDLNKLALLSPDEPDIQLELINIYLDLNNLNNAQEKLKALSSLAQDDPKFWYLQGRLNSLQQDYDAAIRAYQQSLALESEKSSTYKALANSYLAIGQLEQAGDALEQALALSPNDPLAIYIQSEIFKQTNQREAADKALDYISNRISLIDDRTKQLNPQLLLIDAMSSYSGGNWQQSIRKFNSYLENNPDDMNALVLLSQVYHQMDQPEEALRILIPYESQLVMNQEYALVLAVAYVENGDVEAAERLLQRRLVLNKQDVSATLLLVKIYEQQENYQRGYQLLSAPTLPESPLVTQSLATMTYKMQRFAESLTYVDALLDPLRNADASNPSIGLFRVELLRKLGRSEEALTGVDQIIQGYRASGATSPVPASPQIIRVNLLHELGQIAMRNTQFDKLYDLWQSNSTRLLYLAKMQRAMQYETGAEKSFATAVNLSPQNEDAILSYASWLVEQGNSPRAQQLVNTLDSSTIIHKARFLAIKGDISVSLQQAKDAYELYTQAVQGSFTEIATIYKLAQLSREINRENDTTELLKTLIKRYPKRVFLLESLSEHLLEIGDHQHAIFYYSKLLMSPLPLIKQAIALNNIAFLYTQTSQYELAIIHARQAVELRGDIPSFYDTLGWALTLSGQYSQGREHLEYALSLASDSAEIQAHLDYTLDKLGVAVVN